MARRPDDLSIELQLRASGAQQAAGDVQRFAAATDDLARSQSDAAETSQRIASAVEALAQSTGGGLRELVAFNQAFQAFDRVGDLAAEVAQLSDAWANLQGRLKLVTTSEEEHAAASADVVRIAQETGSSLEATGELYTKIAQALKSLGQSAADAGGDTELIAKSFAISGAGAAEAEGAIRQFAQALSSGVLRGDEFNSVMEQAPRLAQALADALGVTSGELRAMAEQGSLSANTVLQALRSQRAAIEADFAKLPETIKRATNSVSVAWLEVVGRLSEGSGAASLAASAISTLADHMDALVAIAGGGALAVLVGQIRKISVATLDTIRATEAQTIAVRRQTEAQLGEVRAAEIAALVRRNETTAQLTQTQARLAHVEALAAEQPYLLRTASYHQQLTAARTANTAALRAASAAEVGYAAAVRTTQAAQATTIAAMAATVGIGGRLLALLGGWPGVMIAAAGAATTFALAQGAVADEAEDVVALLELQAKHLDELSGKSLAGYQGRLEAVMRAEIGRFEAIERQNAGLEAAIARLRAQGAALAEISDIEGQLTTNREAQAVIIANLAKQEDALFEARAKSAKETSNEGQRYLALTRGISAVRDALKTQADTRKDLAQAIDAQAKAEAASAQAVGDEVGALRATADGLARKAGLAREAAAADRILSQELEVQLAGMERLIAAQPELEKGYAKERQGLQEAAAAARIKADTSIALAQTAEIEARTAQIAAQTYGDQSAQVHRLAAEYRAATAELAASQRTRDLGVDAARDLAEVEAQLVQIETELANAATQGAENLVDLVREAGALRDRRAELTKTVATATTAEQRHSQAVTKAAQAQARYKDALEDAVQAQRAVQSDLARNAQLVEREGQVRANHLKILAEEARAKGDLVEASRLTIEAAETEADWAQKVADAKVQEAKQAEDLARALELQALADRNLTAEEREGLAVAMDVARAKKLEADAARDAARAKQVEADATRNAANNTKEGTKAAEQGSRVGRTFISLAGMVARVVEEAGLSVREFYEDLKGAKDRDTYYRTLQKWERAAKAAQAETERLAKMERELAPLIQRLSDGTASAQDMADAMRAAQYGAQYLGEETFGRLLKAIKDAKQGLSDLADQARDTRDALLDELDQIRGNEAAIEQRRYAARKAELDAALREAQAANDRVTAANYREALTLLEQVHRARSMQIEAEAKASAADRESAQRTAEAEQRYARARADLDEAIREAEAKGDRDAEARLNARAEALERQHRERLAQIEAEASAERAAAEKQAARATQGGPAGSGSTRPQPTQTQQVYPTAQTPAQIFRVELMGAGKSVTLDGPLDQANAFIELMRLGRLRALV